MVFVNQFLVDFFKSSMTFHSLTKQRPPWIRQTVINEWYRFLCLVLSNSPFRRLGSHRPRFILSTSPKVFPMVLKISSMSNQYEGTVSQIYSLILNLKILGFLISFISSGRLFHNLAACQEKP